MHLRTSRSKMFTLAATATIAAMTLAGCGASAPDTAPTAEAVGSTPASTPTPAAMPSASASASEQPATATTPVPPAKLKTHGIANGYFELTTPADWTLKQQKTDRAQKHADVATTLDILDANGSLVATLRLGEEVVMDKNPPLGDLAYTQLDRAKPALGQGNSYKFEALGADGREAVMGLDSFDYSGFKSMDGLNPTLSYKNGTGSFIRRIDQDDRLNGVPAGLKGMDRIKAFTATGEYAQIKALMLSLKQTKASTSTASVPQASGKCIGEKYTYEIEDSGLTCAEAKSFVQKFVGKTEEYGTIRLPNLGLCTPPKPGTEGWCEVSKTGTFFHYQLK